MMPTYRQFMRAVSVGVHLLLAAVTGESTATAYTSSMLSPTITTTRTTTTHTVNVGQPTHQFGPDTIYAPAGDIVEFQFFPQNHSVVRAEYKDPCAPYEAIWDGKKTGFFSGFRTASPSDPELPKWQLLINDTEPIFFYCSAPGSCNKYQMVGVINPNANVSLQTQKALAAQATSVLQPGDQVPSEGETNSATPSPSNPASKNSGGLSAGAIVGIVIGIAASLAFAAALLFVKRRLRKAKYDADCRASTIGHPSLLSHPHMSMSSDAPIHGPYEVDGSQESSATYYEKYNVGTRGAEYSRNSLVSPASNIRYRLDSPVAMSPGAPQELEAPDNRY